MTPSSPVKFNGDRLAASMHVVDWAGVGSVGVVGLVISSAVGTSVVGCSPATTVAVDFGDGETVAPVSSVVPIRLHAERRTTTIVAKSRREYADVPGLDIILEINCMPYDAQD